MSMQSETQRFYEGHDVGYKLGRKDGRWEAFVAAWATLIIASWVWWLL